MSSKYDNFSKTLTHISDNMFCGIYPFSLVFHLELTFDVKKIPIYLHSIFSNLIKKDR